MKTPILSGAVAIISLLSTIAHADVIMSVSADTQTAIANLNLTPSNQNVASPLTLSGIFTIDDSADTGAIYTADLVIAGVDNSAGNTIRVNAGGNIVFDEDFATRQDTLMLTVQNFVVTTPGTTATTISFDGFDGLDLGSFNIADGDLATFNGIAVANPLPLLPPGTLAPNGAIFDDTSDLNLANTDGAFNFQGVTGQFTVAAVPEPSSVALLSVVGLGMIVRRRRKQRSQD